MDRLQQLLREIHRRSLWQVLAIYGLTSWAVLQVVDTLTSTLGLPDWFPPFAFALLIVGLPVVLSVAFVQQGGPRPPGTRAERVGPAGVASARTAKSDGALYTVLTWRNAITGGVLALALWGVIAGGWVLLGGRPAGGSAAGAGGERPGLTVLPLENRSADESDGFFTDGLHDELLTQLSKISAIRVISRTSVMGYREREVNTRRIGEELDVEYVLEGGLLRAGDQVRLNVQLIHAPTDEHVWAETYDQTMSVANMLAIQTEIVQNVVRSLRTVLSPTERALIAEAPTDNTEAYEYYVRGRDWLNRGGLTEQEFALGVQFNERATELDPDFALAWAKAASGHVRLYFQGYDRSAERLERARSAVERAVALSPDNPEVREARGDWYYYGLREYDLALTEYRAALEQLPSSGSLIARIAWIQRRRGQWQESLDGLARVRDTDPRSASALLNHGVSLMAMARYAEADTTFRQALALNPEIETLWTLRARNLLLWRGDPAQALASYEPAPQSVLQDSRTVMSLISLSLRARDPRAALDRLRSSPDSAFGTATAWFPRTLLSAQALDQLGDRTAARAAYDSARVMLEHAAAARPDDERVQSVLGLALAGLGRRDDAIAAGERAVMLFPLEQDALWGPSYIAALATIHARLGEADTAVPLLERILGVPNFDLSLASLQIDPDFDPIREDSRFQALLRNQ